MLAFFHAVESSVNKRQPNRRTHTRTIRMALRRRIFEAT